MAAEARALAGVADRQLGRGRQVVDARLPVLAVALALRTVAQLPLGQQIIAEADLERRELALARVERAQLVEQQLDAEIVGDQEVDRDVQDGALAERVMRSSNSGHVAGS